MASPPKPWETIAPTPSSVAGAGGGPVSSTPACSTSAAPSAVATTAHGARPAAPTTGTGLWNNSGHSYGAYGAHGAYGSHGGFGGYGSYGGGGYGGYGGYGGMSRFGGFGGPFGSYGMAGGDPTKDPMPPGLRQLETLLYSVGRIMQMLEMNVEVLQHFVGSMVAFFERMRALYGDACQLSSNVRLQSLEFGESGLTTVREARSHMRRRPLVSFGLICAAFSMLLQLRRWLSHRRLRYPLPMLGVGGDARTAAVALNGAWQSGGR